MATAFVIGVGLLTALYYRISLQLPDPVALRNVRLQTPLEIYSHDRRLIASFGDKKRIPIAIDQIPEVMINAFLAAEDARFYQHPGVDIQGLIRAAWELARSGHKRQGGSTITMQVARNFFLSPKKTYERKVKEILLALKIENELSKKEILELYLNKIYLGQHAYGVAAAAQIYYGKPLAQLDLAQTAMIAGLPKAPSSFNPISNAKRALERRNYVLKRMHELRFISESQYHNAVARPLSATLNQANQQVAASYVAEWVRTQLYERFGETVYTQGYRVITTIDSHLQAAARHAVHHALHAYDERHGYRGPMGHLDINTPNPQRLQAIRSLGQVGATLPALVLAIDNQTNKARLQLAGGKTVLLTWENMRWARKALAAARVGPIPRKAEEILKPGDLIRIRKNEAGQWRLAQIPKVEGALLSVDSRSGAILALQGGYDFKLSKFNRAIQAQRQPGSGFKPILYTAALESGYTAASLINDAPVVYRNAESDWRPENYSGKFYGPTRLRVALRNSRNLVSIRLLQAIGLDKVINTALRFGFKPQQLPRTPTLALGSGTASLLEMATVYSVFANGGFRVEPYIIEQIQLQGGKKVETSSPRKACEHCEHAATRILTPRIHYLMHSLLKDVVRRGTGAKARQLGRADLAGKTGTTNDQRDAWFNGYAPPMVAISWVGYDSSQPLGHGETGARAALPMWMEYMRVALADSPESDFSRPDGLVTALIDPETGHRTHSHPGAVTEIFREELVPDYRASPQRPASNNRSESILNSLF